MPRKQDRRSIYVKPENYDKLKQVCDREGSSMSGKVEKLITNRLDREEKRKESER